MNKKFILLFCTFAIRYSIAGESQTIQTMYLEDVSGKINLKDINTKLIESFSKKVLEEIPSFQTAVTFIKNNLDKMPPQVLIEQAEHEMPKDNMINYIQFIKKNIDFAMGIFFTTVLKVQDRFVQSYLKNEFIQSYIETKYLPEQLKNVIGFSYIEAENIIIKNIPGTQNQKALRVLFFALSRQETITKQEHSNILKRIKRFFKKDICN